MEKEAMIAELCPQLQTMLQAVRPSSDSRAILCFILSSSLSLFLLSSRSIFSCVSVRKASGALRAKSWPLCSRGCLYCRRRQIGSTAHTLPSSRPGS